MALLRSLPSPSDFFLSCTVILALFDTVSARTVHKEPFKLILTPIHAAALALAILFSLIFLIQSLSAAGKLGNKTKVLPSGLRGATYYVGPVYSFLIFFAGLSLVVYYILYAVTIIYTLNKSVRDLKPVTSVFVAGRDFVLHIAHWFILCSTIALLFVRQRIRRGEKESSDQGWSRVVEGVVDGVMLMALLTVIITSAALTGSLQKYDEQKALSALSATRAYVALQAILTFYVILSAAWTWKKLRKDSEPDLIMIGQIVKYISPFLILFAIFQITEYAFIYNSFMLYSSPGTVDDLLIARIIIIGVTNAIILWFAS
ncbi:hypothetical protein D9756_008788 [Leucocoprinus leucothites]|uniref:Uncharacterized protein n=1 Tax=Leucocoprinus leucothites TaxID=201217 RepID=A0A8H5CXR8_9AGAR|nr:hypothetical protein D9756_008788 [Leucoagaricus leucothites]